MAINRAYLIKTPDRNTSRFIANKLIDTFAATGYSLCFQESNCGIAFTDAKTQMTSSYEQIEKMVLRDNPPTRTFETLKGAKTAILTN